MKPRIKLASAETPDGQSLTLYEHDGAFVINLNGQELMHSRATSSERLLGEVGVARIKAGTKARILIGGLGLGFTLCEVLNRVGPGTVVEVVELLPAVIEWNRLYLNGLHGDVLNDPRVKVLAGDVVETIQRAGPGSYDAILLDIDNGPVAMVAAANTLLYAVAGLADVRRALRPGGRVVFWSAGPDRRFADRLRSAGFVVDVVPAKAHDQAKRAACLLYVGHIV